MSWLDRLKAHKGDVYRPGQTLPEPGYETATGRKLYTVQQIRAAYAQGQRDSLSLLRRARNLLSHPPGWVDTPTNSESRYALSVEIAEHMNGLGMNNAQVKEWQDNVTAPPQQPEPVEPVAWADKISFENSMKTGKGHDVWPKAGDYETRTGRALIGLYTAPPQRPPLSDEEILEAVGWERAEMYMKLTPNFPVEEAKKETIKNARAIERKVRGEER